MKIGIISKVSMFFSSYTLLFLSLGIKYNDNKGMWYMLLFSIVGCIATYFILKTKINPSENKIIKIQAKNDQVAGYLVTYLIPFLGFNFNDITDAISFLIIFFIICVMYIKADLIYMNPTLMLTGYNIYEVIFTDEKKRILISKRELNDLRIVQKICYYELQDRYIIIER